MRIGTDRCIQAAATFLGDLRREFGSWFLALAAYNAEPEEHGYENPWPGSRVPAS